MARKDDDSRSIAQILNSLEKGNDSVNPTGFSYANNNDGKSWVQPWDSPSGLQPTSYHTDNSIGAHDGEIRDLFSNLLRNMLTRGTLAHAVTVLAVLTLAAWVIVTFLLPTLMYILANVLELVVPTIIVTFAMCAAVASLFRH